MFLKDYCRRMKMEIPERADLHTLQILLKAQAEAIPFENLDVHLFGKVEINRQKIVEKLLHSRRGGYCYEVNGLLAMALESLGFQYELLGARTIMGYKERRPVTHMVLQVFLERKAYLCDLGFSGMSGSFPMEIPQSRRIEKEDFAIERDEHGTYLMEHRNSRGEWNSLYSFETQAMEAVDFQLANYFNSTSPQSICTQHVICSRDLGNGMAKLVDNRFTLSNGGDLSEETVTHSLRLGEILMEYFHVELDDPQLATLGSKLGLHG